MFESLIERIIETKVVPSPELEQYLDSLLGNIDCGQEVYIGDSMIITMERERINKTKSFIVFFIERYIRNGCSIAAAEMDFNSRFPQDFLLEFPEQISCSFDMELSINSYVLGISKLVLGNIRSIQRKFRTICSASEGIKLEMNSRIRKRAMYYGNCLESLISQQEQAITELKERNDTSFDFDNPTIISYKRKIKITPKGGK